MFDRIEFLILEAFTSLRRNLLMTFAAVTTAAVALFLLGGLAYAYIGINQFASEVTNKFEMRVWLKDVVTDEMAKTVLQKVQAVPGVRTASLVPKDVEWARRKKQQPEITRGWENVLPHSIKITLAEIKDARSVETLVKRIEGVSTEDVVYMKDEQKLMEQSLGVLRWLGLLLGALLLVTAGILIFNAIKLTAIARRREVRIMLLVGASRYMIQMPFILEGMLQGAIGGILAALLIGGAHAGFQRVVNTIMVGAQFAPFPVGWSALFLACLGAGYGGVCSYWAIKDSLRYRAGVAV